MDQKLFRIALVLVAIAGAVVIGLAALPDGMTCLGNLVCINKVRR